MVECFGDPRTKYKIDIAREYFVKEKLANVLFPAHCVSEGDRWYSHRKLITPTFHFNVLESFVDVFVARTQDFMGELKAFLADNQGQFIDISPFTRKLTLDFICETAMGTPADAKSYEHTEIVKAMHRLEEIGIYRMVRPWLLSDFIFRFTAKGRDEENYKQILHQFTDQVIQMRRQALAKQKYCEDFIDRGLKKRAIFMDLLIASSDGGNVLSDQDIREEVNTFMFAAHPAENLLKSDNNKRWKCKSGEKQAIVILQLKQSVVIEAIDIGNEHSAFVEVLVGRSSSTNEDYKVLLVASSLMTLREAKDSVNVNGVRFFKKADLTKPTCDEKWDRVKIICTQPFNKHVQYGLSFVTLHAAGDSGGSGETSAALGRFALKEDKEESPAVGSWFAKRKDPPAPVPPGAAAAARDALSPASIAQRTNKKPTPKRPKADTPKNGTLKPDKASSKNPTPNRDPAKVQKQLQHFQMSLGDDDSPADDTDADSTYSPTKDSASVLSDDEVIPDDSDEERPQKRAKRAKKDNSIITSKVGATLNGKTPKQKVNDSGGKKPKPPKETKPFNRLLEGVTIVISGYQNPLRGELRSKACAMGARYKADWDNTCTHLICAFVNTPKFNQVQGRGKIVKKDWVEKCHSQRKRLPWRRFALDINDAGTSSEEEIWEEESVPTTSGANTIASGANRRRVSSGSGSDTEEEIEKVKARQAQTKKAAKPTDKPPDKPTDPFSADTDVESDSESQTGSLPLPPLPRFFTNITFHIASDIDDDERRKLYRYIVAYNGSVADEMDGSVEYAITRLPDVAAEIQEEYGVSCINPEWIWECSDAGRFIPVNQFIL